MVDDLDAALTEYEARLTEACEQDFALVGGGAVFDEDPNGARVGLQPAERPRLRRVRAAAGPPTSRCKPCPTRSQASPSVAT